MKNYKVYFPKEAATAHLLMTPLGRNEYRLEETAVLLEETLFFHDVIRAKKWIGRGLQFQRLVNKSGLQVYDFLLSQELAGSEEIQALLRRVTSGGGHWETVFSGILFVYLPADAKMNPEEEIQMFAETGKLQAVSTAPPHGTRSGDITFNLR